MRDGFAEIQTTNSDENDGKLSITEKIFVNRNNESIIGSIKRSQSKVKEQRN